MLDEKDSSILEELMMDSRKTTKAIARELGIPRATVHDRIVKMEQKHIIKKYTAVPDYSQLGLGVIAFILVQFESEKGLSQRDTADDIASISGIFEVHMISGEYDMLLKVRGSSMEEIGKLVIDRLREVKGVARTLTCACFTTVKE
ncbi:MAG: Lrp/AsnC family transcriptional regulator [Thermoplasmatota archaeon]|jgi:DNA-binding Lrp family transcriptional regulator|nr:Lrp/AsnC family transcriptional regulator [Candidatus Thermoplasmatota archaeon]MBU1915261.1 Lrp/AsnC family transcriptional regulator [Candidatus Thermoplasmatota archaeon]